MPLSDWTEGMSVIVTDITNDPKGRVVRTTITKVGRKYVTVRGGRQFDVSHVPGTEHNPVYSGAFLYNPEQFEEEVYKQKVRTAVLDHFDNRGGLHVELSLALRIGDVLGIEKPAHLKTQEVTIEELRTKVEALRDK